MNKPEQHEVIGKADLIERRDFGTDERDPLTCMTVGLINILSEAMAKMRQEAPVGIMEGPLITALITYAGTLHGEMVTMGLSRDMTKEATLHMLLTNFTSGQNAGRRRVEEIAEQEGVDPTTGMPPE
jgi:hypothetical protein